jgi:hypothetical protein
MYEGICIITQIKTKNLISIINEKTKHPTNELKNTRLVNLRYSSTIFLNCCAKPVKKPVLILSLKLPNQRNNITKRIQNSELGRTTSNYTQERPKRHHLDEITFVKNELPIKQHAAKPSNL